MALTNKQTRFVSALSSVTKTSPVSRQDLIRASKILGNDFPPAWIVNDLTRRADRGMYLVPEIGGVVQTPAVETTVPTSVPEVSSASFAATFSTESSILGMTGGDRATLVPIFNAEYVSWGHHRDIEKIIKAKIFSPVFITGMSGNGKTTMVEQICANLNRECHRVNIIADTDEDDLLGGFRLVNGSMLWHDGPVTQSMKRGSILLLDEIDLGSDKMMCLQSVLEGKGVYLKKINTWVTPAMGFTILATANTKGKGSDDGRFIGTRVMNEAMLDRFDFTFEQEYAPKATEKKILSKFMKKYDVIDDVFADNLVAWAGMIRFTFNEGACDEIISTRRLLNIIKAYAMFNNKTKAIKMALARFDILTQESFYSSYTKIDADVVPDNASPVTENTTASTEIPAALRPF